MGISEGGRTKKSLAHGAARGDAPTISVTGGSNIRGRHSVNLTQEATSNPGAAIRCLSAKMSMVGYRGRCCMAAP